MIKTLFVYLQNVQWELAITIQHPLHLDIKRRHLWIKIIVKTLAYHYNFIKLKHMRNTIHERCLEDVGEAMGGKIFMGI